MHPASAANCTTVTASDRLARRLHEQVADAYLAAGKRAWERPDILPVGAFWRRLAGELQQQAGLPIAARRVLSRAAMHCRWEVLLAEAFVDKPLLQTAGAAKSALDAWQLCRDWLLDVDALANDPLDETRLLVEWGRRFEQECAERGLLPEYALPDAVLGALEQSAAHRVFLPQRIRLAGFMELSPRDRQRWNSLRELGVTVDELEAPATAADVTVVACSDARAEIASVAAWARAQLQHSATQRIAIVVPDLAARRTALENALAETLCPERIGTFDDSPLPFNFSLGQPLAERALVADALLVLAMSQQRLEFAAAARLCRSPYLGLPGEHLSRLRLESILRHDGYAELSLKDFAFVARREQLAEFAAALDALRSAVQEDNGDALPSVWARRFSRWLEVAGWCRARTLDSNEYQAREAFNELLGKLGELDIVLGDCSRSVALTWLNRFAGETAFQPRAADAPVQVLGLLEASGLEFDAVWVTGLADDVLPAAPRPNPFLPVDLQRAKRLPQSSAARELEFAQQVFAGLQRATPELKCSYPLHEGDAELGASPLLRPFPLVESPTLPPSPAQQRFRAVALEAVRDDRAPGHPGGHVRGGTALLQDQSHCPFRAFAVHRLHADDWPTPQPGPDALVRGLVTHRILEKLWSLWRTRAHLEKLHSKGELGVQVAAVVAEVLADNRRRMQHRWNDSLQLIEQRRLASLVMRWVEQVELQRPDFEVVEIEGRTGDGNETHTVVQAGPLQLRGKLDRVDRLADGRELIIDYKSGEAPGKNDFFGERPRAPQLPAYLVARKQAGRPVAAGIAVASLKTGSEKLQGVMRVDGDEKQDPGIAGLVNVAKTREVGDWDEAVEFWEAAVRALGTSFAEGDARVDPLRGACDYCHLATLCRIDEQRRDAEEDNGD